MYDIVTISYDTFPVHKLVGVVSDSVWFITAYTVAYIETD